MLRTLLVLFSLLPSTLTDSTLALGATPTTEASATETVTTEPHACTRSDTPSHPRLRRFQEHAPTIGPAPTPEHITVGVPQEDASTTLSFGWKTGARTLASQVQIRKKGDTNTHTIDGFTFSYRALEPSSRRMHEVQVCGLEAATTYEYRVGTEDHWSSWNRIRTLVPPGSQETHRIVIAGDSRSSMRVFGRIAEAIATHEPDLVFFTGDLVGDGRVQAYWDHWFTAGRTMFAQTIFIPILGNHEYDAVNYFGQFMMPEDERNFSLDIGDVTWTVFDDDGPESRVTSTVLPRLTALLERTQARARWIVLHHRPLYSATHRGGNRVRRTHLLPIFETIYPDMIFTAHNHNYERSCKIANETCVDDTEPGTVYLTSAGAGANLIPSGTRWFTEASESVFHFVVLTIEGEKISGEVHALDGRVIDRFELPPPFARDTASETSKEAPPPANTPDSADVAPANPFSP